MNNLSSNIFPSRPLVFEKNRADDVVCSRLGLNELILQCFPYCIGKEDVLGL
jgi:hypothetical protein